MVSGKSKSANVLVEIGARIVVESELSIIFTISSGTSKFLLLIKLPKETIGAEPSVPPPPTLERELRPANALTTRPALLTPPPPPPPAVVIAGSIVTSRPLYVAVTGPQWKSPQDTKSAALDLPLAGRIIPFETCVSPSLEIVMKSPGTPKILGAMH